MKKIFIILLIMFVSNVWSNDKNNYPDTKKDIAISTVLFCAKEGLSFPESNRENKCTDLKYLLSGGLLHKFQGKDSELIHYVKSTIMVSRLCEVACNNPDKIDRIIDTINKTK